MQQKRGSKAQVAGFSRAEPSLDCCAAGVVFATPQGHTFEVHTPIPDRIYDRRHLGAGINPIRMDHVNITSPEPAETQRQSNRSWA